MICCNLFLFFCAISTNLWIVGALNAENVLGGSLAEQSNFKYHATIIGKNVSSDDDIDTLCNGGFIKEDLLLSIATCFLNSTGHMKPYNFFIIAGTSNILSAEGISIWIDTIYVPKFDHIDNLIDISVSKLHEGVSFQASSLFSQLSIPIADNKDEQFIAILAGCESLEELQDVSLKFIQVEILKESVYQGLASKEKYESMQHKKLKLARVTSEHFGLSKADAGSPLVVGETVIGVAIEIYSAETSLDNLVSYTDVYQNREFIELAKQVSPNLEYVFRFRNEVPSA